MDDLLFCCQGNKRKIRMCMGQAEKFFQPTHHGRLKKIQPITEVQPNTCELSWTHGLDKFF